MNNEFIRLTVRGLKELARGRGLRRYSRLRRAELIDLLINTGGTILDSDIENIRTPVLQPTPALPPTPVTPPTQQTVEELVKSLERVREVPKNISPELNALKNKIEKLYSEKDKVKIVEGESALRGFYKRYTIEGIGIYGPRDFLELTRKEIVNTLNNNQGRKVKCILIKDTEEGLKTKNANFHSDSFLLNLRGTDINDLYDTMVEEVLEDLERLLRISETGWRFYRVLDLQLHTVSYNPIRARSYIPLPRELSLKKAIINIKNYKDNKCFSWCVLRALKKNIQKILTKI